MTTDEIVVPAGTPAELASVMRDVTKLQLRAEVRRELEEELAAKLGKGSGIPKLSLKSAPRYIARVAAAVQERRIDATQANVMLYAAQLLIAAERVRNHEPKRLGRPPKGGRVVEATA